MGNSSSSKAERERQIKSVAACLQEHEEAVEGISHSVQTQKALVEKLDYEIKHIRVREIDEKEKQNEDPIRCCHCTSEWQDITQRLLVSVQSSLRKQSVVLYGTFKRLNLCVQTIKDYYKIGNDWPVDNANDKFSIPYNGSPGTDYYEDYKMYEWKCNTLEQSLKYLESKNTQYAQQIEEITQKHEKNMMENNEELQKLRNENAKLESDINKLNGNSKGLEQVIQDLQSSIDDLRTEKIVLQQDLDRSKQTFTVQLFHNLKGGMISTLLYELKSMLATQLDIKRHVIRFVLCQSETDIDPEVPVLVLCINVSSLETDAGLAIQNLKVSSKMAILIFHHKDVHALPNQASERVLTESKFKDLGGFFDIGFLSGKGIYACDMNRAALIGMERFLRALGSC